MKKIVFMAVAIAAVSFASCGNKTEAPATCVDTNQVDTNTVTPTDTNAVAGDPATAGDSATTGDSATAPVAQ